MIEVLAADLDRVVQNVLLYTNKKAIRLQEVFFVVYFNKFQSFACDDYIAVSDLLEFEGKGEPAREFSLDIPTAEKLGEWIKKDLKVVHKEKIKVSFFNTYLKVKSEDGDLEKFEYMDKPASEAWDLVMELLDADSPALKEIWDFAVRPDRFAKLARLKADKEAPLMFRGIDINGHLVLQFKKGHSLVGAAMPIDQAYIKEEFLWKNPSGFTDPSPSSTSTDSVQSFTDLPT